MELKTYIPASFRPYLKMNRGSQGNEHRRLSIMVVNLEVSYQNQTKQNFEIVQKLVEIV